MKKRLLYCICCVVTVMMLTACSGVNSLIKDIAALENVTLDSEEAIISASQKYEALDEADKEKITNIDILENAKMKYVVLEIQEKMKVACASEEVTFSELDEIMQVYAGFSDAQKETLNTELYADFDNRYKAAEIDMLIEEAVANASVSNFGEVDELLTRYNSLNDAIKIYVKNLESLETTHAKYKDEFVASQVSYIIQNYYSGKDQYNKFKHLMTREQKINCLKSVAKNDAVRAADSKLRSMLRAPDSYRVISMTPWWVVERKDEYCVSVTIEYSAMNGFGGYNRDSKNFDVYFSINPDSAYPITINRVS